MIDGLGEISDDVVSAAPAMESRIRKVREIIGQVAFNMLTNYFNTMAGTPLDFPIVDAVSS